MTTILLIYLAIGLATMSMFYLVDDKARQRGGVLGFIFSVVLWPLVYGFLVECFLGRR